VRYRKKNLYCLSGVALAVASLFVPHGVYAQEADKKSADEQRLKEVEVVGTSPLPGIGIEKDKLPYDVQTVTDEQLYRGQSLNLTDYMSRNLLGVNINEVQGSPFQADITYRGFRLSGILGSSQGMSVYLDGVRVNEPFGDVVNWDMIPESAINNVTLVPGSNPIYGLNTLGGALAFTTKSGLTAPGTEVKLQAGSFGRMRADVAYGSKSDDGYHNFISATGFREDGWRDYSNGQLGNVFAKVGRQQDDSNWTLSLLHGRSNLLGNGLLPSYSYGSGLHFANGAESDDGTATFTSRTAGMYETNRRWVYTHSDRTENQLTMVNFGLQRLLDSETELALNAYVRNSKRKTVGGDAEIEAEFDPVTDVFDGHDIDAVLNKTSLSQTSYGSSVNLTKILENHQLNAGASFDASKSSFLGSQDSRCTLSDTRGVSGCTSSRDEAKLIGKSYALGVYASDTFKVDERTHLTAAARFNHAQVKNDLTSYVNANGDAVNRNTNESFSYNSLNPSIGATYKSSEAITLFGNIGQSNRVPTAIELGCADANYPCRLPTGLQADPYLKQVIARTIETGFRWKLSGDTSMSASIYRSENKDDILFRSLTGSGLGYFQNFSKTRRQGLDLSAFTTFGPVTVQAGYSYLEATYQASGILFGGEREIEIKPGTKIAGLPEHTFKIASDYKFNEKLTLGGTVLGVTSSVSQGNEDGKVGFKEGADIDQQSTVNAKISGYFLLNLHGIYQAEKGLEYFARVNNVLDARHETYGLMAMSMFDANGAVVSGPATVNRFVAPGAPRNFMVGLRYRF